MKLPPETTFGDIVKFMYLLRLLKNKNVIIRPAQKDKQIYVISQSRKI